MCSSRNIDAGLAHGGHHDARELGVRASVGRGHPEVARTKYQHDQACHRSAEADAEAKDPGDSVLEVDDGRVADDERGVEEDEVPVEEGVLVARAAELVRAQCRHVEPRPTSADGQQKHRGVEHGELPRSPMLARGGRRGAMRRPQGWQCRGEREQNECLGNNSIVFTSVFFRRHKGYIFSPTGYILKSSANYLSTNFLKKICKILDHLIALRFVECFFSSVFLPH